MPQPTASMIAMHKRSPLWSAFTDGMSAQDLKSSTATMTGDIARLWLEKGHRYGMLRKARKGRFSVFFRTDLAPNSETARANIGADSCRPMKRTPWSGIVVHRRGGWIPGTGGYGTDIEVRA